MVGEPFVFMEVLLSVMVSFEVAVAGHHGFAKTGRNHSPGIRMTRRRFEVAGFRQRRRQDRILAPADGSGK
jgi:hypothetical protein